MRKNLFLKKEKVMLFFLLIIGISINAQVNTVIASNNEYYTGNLIETDPDAQSTYMIRDKDQKMYKKGENNMWTLVNMPNLENLKDFYVDMHSNLWAYNPSQKKIIFYKDNGQVINYYDVPLPNGTFLEHDKIIIRKNKLYFTISLWPSGGNAYISNLYSTPITPNGGIQYWTGLPLNDTTGYAGGGGGSAYLFKIFDDGSIYDDYYPNQRISYDYGLTWSNHTFNIPQDAYAKFISNDKKTIAYTGNFYPMGYQPYISNDSGNTFFKPAGIPQNTPIAKMLSHNDMIILNSNFGSNGHAKLSDGLYISRNKGVSFQKLNNNYNFWDNASSSINFNIKMSGIISSSKFKGFTYVTTDNQTNYPLDNGISNEIPKNIAKIDTDSQGRLYAYSTLIPIGSAMGPHDGRSSIYGLFISENDGLTWKRDKDLWGPYHAIGDFAVSNNNTVYAVGYDPGKIIKSINGGINWNYLPQQYAIYSLIRIFTDKVNSNRIVTTAKTSSGSNDPNYTGTLFSNNGGQTFGTPFGGYYKPVDFELAEDVLFYDANKIIILLPNKILKTENNGVTWNQVSSPNFKKIVGDPSNNILFATTENSVYNSVDGGVSWQFLYSNNSIINSIVLIDYLGGKTPIISTEEGVFVLKNGNFTWLSSNKYKFMAYSESNKKLFLANANNMDSFEVANLSIEDNVKRKKNILYPNPAKDFVSIKNGRAESFVYQIVDISGKIVKTGKAKTDERIDVRGLEKGNYVLWVESESREKESFKLIKNK